MKNKKIVFNAEIVNKICLKLEAIYINVLNCLLINPKSFFLVFTETSFVTIKFVYQLNLHSE